MKTEFHHRLVNGPHGDPCLYIRLFMEKRALLFDLGNIYNLAPSDLQKITEVFVTHTHIDHFIGFDTLLRALLRREQPISFYGPENIIECIEGKLAGYTWNLIKEYPLKMEAFGVGKNRIRHSSFYAEHSFKRIDRDEDPFDGVILIGPAFRVKTAVLSHGVPCLGFSLEEAFHINIDKEALGRAGLPVGPWLNKFKKMLREKVSRESVIEIEGREFKISGLMNIVRITEGQKLSYITDISPDEENIRLATDLVKASDTLYCEAFFLNEDMERAIERRHLTAGLAGKIARQAGVKSLVLMHFSPRYKDRSEQLQAEAMSEFLG